MSLFAVIHCIRLNSPARSIHIYIMHGLVLLLCVPLCCVSTASGTSVSRVNLVLMGFLYAVAGVSLNQMRFQIHFAVLDDACAYKKF